MSDDDSLNCGSGGGATTYTGLRIASVFIIWAGSTFGALFPVLARKSTVIAVPHSVFEFAKYFGSGVIIATAFIHLLDPAIDELSSPCLSDAWRDYPYALALALASIFFIFIVELLAFRIGTAKLKKLGIRHDAHGHGVGALSAHGPESGPAVSSAPVSGDPPSLQLDIETVAFESEKKEKSVDSDDSQVHEHDELVSDEGAAAQVIGIAILEFGVILHSVLIGLTLAVDEGFKILFVVIVFHQLFEGLGIGSRLAYLSMPRRYRHVPVFAALLYGLTTPLGIAVGLGVRTTYNPGSARASVVSGVLDALSAGILIYTGLVELLAHEFLFSREMREASNAKLLYALSCMLFGCGIMALLGKWA
ncbi:ZIP-like iron-zinc transporter [Gloeopeniophorella convolvens]|nr:ZIP-like iron-zinc transporter [Gloeopeniophorella convolvens]